MSEIDIRERLSNQQSAFFAIFDTHFCAAIFTMESSFGFVYYVNTFLFMEE